MHDGQVHAEVVGVTRNGYDVVQFADLKVVRNVPRHELQPA